MKHSKIFTALFFCAFLLSNLPAAEAQRGRALLSFGKSILRGLAEKAVVLATIDGVKSYFNETPANRYAIQVSITNDYDSAFRFQIYDGFNWRTCDLYPGYYTQIQSSSQGAIVIYDGSNYYMIGTSGAYDLSEL